MKIALGVEYDGCRFFGWQRQQEVTGVQNEIERCLTEIVGHPVEVYCAGRTDAGVHATGQVIHFETDVERALNAYTYGMNSKLPDGVAIRWAKQVDDSFHARFSATARRYRYVIYNNRMRPAILHSGLSHYPLPLDVDKMQAACPALLGEHDFSSFRAAQCQSHSPNRNIMHLSVSRFADYIVVDIKANAFVHHMVRNITGCLIEIGLGRQPVEWLATLLAAKDRTQAAATAKPNGLFLIEVDYPEHFAIPKTALGPLFIPD